MTSQTECAGCTALASQSADIDPHEQLSGETHALCSAGVIEAYKCRCCGAKLERFVATKAFGARSGSWKTLSR